jgi:hypothetical protein
MKKFYHHQKDKEGANASISATALFMTLQDLRLKELFFTKPEKKGRCFFLLLAQKWYVHLFHAT